MRGALSLLLLAVALARQLVSRSFDPLPVGSMTPKGWLLQQLKLQAEGLSGHLSMFWEDVMDSVWIGGKGDGDLHERAPYWLNGIVPLAYLLRNAGIEELAVHGLHKQVEEAKPKGGGPICQNGTDMMYHDISTFPVASVQECLQRCNETANCVGWVVNDCVSPIQCWLKDTNAVTNSASCRCYAEFARPIPPVNLMAQTRKYLDYILSHAQQDGWLGPPDLNDGAAYWSRSNVMLALSMLAEGERNDTALFNNITATMVKYMMAQRKRMATVPMNSWAAQRWQDMGLGAQWLLENAPMGQEDALWDYLDSLAKQGSDWELFFTTFKDEPRGANHHNVNVAQALKSAAVLYRQTANSSLPGLSLARMKKLDEMFGLPTGMFNGDEILPDPPTRNPSRGIELCGVVEAMFSYTTMLSVHGNLSFGDRAELIAFNALPATWASPRGGDMWAHQYLQAVNEINAIYADPHVWQNDGPLSETYGLEPNFGCCTANFNQGWPKLANMAVMSAANKTGAFVALLLPVAARLPNGAVVDVSTSYPFEDGAAITCQTPPDLQKPMPLYIRIPAWADGATINGVAVSAPSLSLQSCAPRGATSKFDLRFQPAIRLEAWGDASSLNSSAYSVLRGALLFSLPIAANYTVYGHHFGSGTEASNDYYLDPTMPWNFALDADPADPSKSLQFVQGSYSEGDAPFNHSGWPVSVVAQVRPVPSWTIFQNSAAAPPQSPACVHTSCGNPAHTRLVPHGGTDLRVGLFPLTGL